MTVVAEGARRVHYVEWPPIIAGAVIASAIATVLVTFGTAIGLSMVSAYPNESASKPMYLVTLGVWTLLVVIISFTCGGYIAGRLRRRADDPTETEVEIRDGAHGLTAWALTVVLASLLLAAGVSGVAGGAAKVTGASAAERQGGLTQFTVDTLFRPAPMATGVSFARATDRLTDADRQEAVRLLTYGMTKDGLAAEDRTYLADLIADRTGLSRADAEGRLDSVLAKARKTADTARKAAVVAGFLLAAMLAIGAAIAVGAAAVGGRHRDQEAGASRFWRWTYQ